MGKCSSIGRDCHACSRKMSKKLLLLALCVGEAPKDSCWHMRDRPEMVWPPRVARFSRGPPGLSRNLG